MQEAVSTFACYRISPYFIALFREASYRSLTSTAFRFSCYSPRYFTAGDGSMSRFTGGSRFSPLHGQRVRLLARVRRERKAKHHYSDAT